MLTGLRLRLSDIARRSAFGIAGAVLMLVALGFFTAAGWHGLRLSLAPHWAAMIIGTVYLVIGLVLMLLSRGEPAPDPLTTPPSTPMERVISSFFAGMEAGKQVRRTRD